jgi:hypothetical protein
MPSKPEITLATVNDAEGIAKAVLEIDWEDPSFKCMLHDKAKEDLNVKGVKDFFQYTYHDEFRHSLMNPENKVFKATIGTRIVGIACVWPPKKRTAFEVLGSEPDQQRIAEKPKRPLEETTEAMYDYYDQIGRWAINKQARLQVIEKAFDLEERFALEKAKKDTLPFKSEYTLT